MAHTGRTDLRHPNLVTTERLIEAFRRGEVVILVDDETRENEGDFVLSAEQATAEKIAFVIRHSGGIVCLAMDNERADALELPPMVANNTSKRGTAFTVSIEAADVPGTGISASDRAHTIRAAGRQQAKGDDFARPGHVFPLRAHDAGVLGRNGHTEAAVDLCRLAQASSSGRDFGSHAR